LFLVDYVKKFNQKFAIPSAAFPSLFVKAPERDDILKILSVISERTVDAGHSIRYKKQYYRTIEQSGFPCYLNKKTKGLVIETFDHQLFFSVSRLDKKETVYMLEAIPEHERLSSALPSCQRRREQRKVNIPKSNHPWRLDSWNRHLDRQKHRAGLYMAN
jgi:hypothetical protein